MHIEQWCSNQSNLIKSAIWHQYLEQSTVRYRHFI